MVEVTAAHLILWLICGIAGAWIYDQWFKD